jgi:hypothetical protein
MSKPRSYEDIMNRIRTAQGVVKSAGADTEALTGIKDPADKGSKAIPDHPEGDSKAKTKLPSGEPTNSESLNKAQIPGDDLKVSGTGKDVPGTTSGDAKDSKATSPTAPIDKIASIMGRIKDMRTPKTEPAKEPVKSAAAPVKDETVQQMQITPEFHFKLASEILATEEGVQFAERILQKAAGVEAAKELIRAAGEQQYMMAKAAYEQEQYEAAVAEELAQREAVVAELTKNASAEDLKEIQKIASVHNKVASALVNDFEKQAYQAGAMDAAAMEDAVGEGEEVPAEAEGPGIEEMLAILEEAVQSGEIDEETAMAVAEQLMAEAGGEGGEAGMEGAEAPMPEEAAMAAQEAEKMASELL